MVWTSSKWGQFWVWSLIWPWRSRSIAPKNNRDLNQGVLLLWTKFGDPSLNGWWIIAQTISWLTDTQTHRHTQATTIPEGQNWPRVKTADNLQKMSKRFVGYHSNVLVGRAFINWQRDNWDISDIHYQHILHYYFITIIQRNLSITTT